MECLLSMTSYMEQEVARVLVNLEPSKQNEYLDLFLVKSACWIKRTVNMLTSVCKVSEEV